MTAVTVDRSVVCGVIHVRVAMRVGARCPNRDRVRHRRRRLAQRKDQVGVVSRLFDAPSAVAMECCAVRVRYIVGRCLRAPDQERRK